MAWYKTGTVAVTNGSTTVTGTGTDFINGVRAGESFVDAANVFYEIASITSATVLVLAKNYAGSTATGQSYAIAPTQNLVKDLASSVTTLVNNFTAAGAGNFEDGSVGAPGIAFSADLNTGFYRIGNDNLGVAVGGTKVIDITPTAVSFTYNLLVGTTSTTLYSSGAGGATGILLDPNGPTTVARSGAIVSYFNRLDTQGDILALRRDGSTVGTLGSVGSDLYIVNGDTGLRFNNDVDSIYPVQSSGTSRDNAIDLGFSSIRFDDIYATNGTIQTSDKNEKQDIEELSDAEQRVAVAAKKLLRKFRWKDRVVEKGEDARIHFGIIAQDLQAAFEAEGLDSGSYAMFIKTEWWEADVTRPVIPAVTDDNGNVLEEEQPELTYTEHYETKAEAPKGAVKKCRLGVRYSELLAFIIAGI